jgi:hypothetical protein
MAAKRGRSAPARLNPKTRRTKKTRSTSRKNSRAQSPRLTKSIALELVAKAIADLIAHDYRKRFTRSFKIAATWSKGKKPGSPADQIRNAFDHLSRASDTVSQIFRMQSSGSGPANAKLQKLFKTVMRHVIRAKRHISLGNYRAVVFTINTVEELALERIEEIEKRTGTPFDDKYDELDKIYSEYRDFPKAKTTRAHDDERLLAAIQDQDKLADDIELVARKLTLFYKNLDKLLKPSARQRGALSSAGQPALLDPPPSP